ncbi:hypothetical protein AVEN_86246-1 [Araneus ventricosus]|uniref:Uncharacterized protein n=1 Tax=Araneus ventricosus TaxID=182803 RepID=A0A4Y2DIH8_ARAVE|nr:hypothetical protein AVEN_86246-1 [Araneus ventricosus]
MEGWNVFDVTDWKKTVILVALNGSSGIGCIVQALLGRFHSTDSAIRKIYFNAMVGLNGADENWSGAGRGTGSSAVHFELCIIANVGSGTFTADKSTILDRGMEKSANNAKKRKRNLGRRAGPLDIHFIGTGLSSPAVLLSGTFAVQIPVVAEKSPFRQCTKNR